MADQGENCDISNNNGITAANTNSSGGRAMEQLDLPPGFRFHPTDEEIINHYLIRKVLNSNFTATAVAEVDLNRNEPWDLPSKLSTASEIIITVFIYLFIWDFSR